MITMQQENSESKGDLDINYLGQDNVSLPRGLQLGGSLGVVRSKVLREFKRQNTMSVDDTCNNDVNAGPTTYVNATYLAVSAPGSCEGRGHAK